MTDYGDRPLPAWSCDDTPELALARVDEWISNYALKNGDIVQTLGLGAGIIDRCGRAQLIMLGLERGVVITDLDGALLL